MRDHELDACLGLVADQDRRCVIQYLRREGHDETAVETLVEQLHGDGSVTRYDSPSDRDAIHAQLHHNHLPKLADYDVIDFDPAEGTVRYRAPDRIESILDALSGDVPESVPRV